MLADGTPGAEPDIDAMDDAQFAEFKSKMLSGEEAPASETTQEPEPEQSETVADADLEDDDHDDDAGDKAEYVPHAKFHRTNERRKQAEKEAQELREKLARVDERLTILQQDQQAKQQHQDQAKQPNPDDDLPDDNDPLAILNWAKKEILERKKQEREQAQQREAQTREQQEWQAIVSAVQPQYDRAVQADPSVVEARNAWRRSIGEEMLAMGYTQAEALAHIEQAEAQHVRYVYANGRDIAEHIKTLARVRGWSHQAPQQPPVNDPAKQIEVVANREKAREASLTLSKTPGAAAELNRITPEMLAEMSDEDFAKYREKHGSVAAAFR